MSAERSHPESKTVEKAEASTSSTNRQNPLPVIAQENDQTSSPMLQLNIDCFEELFEWLAVADLLALRQTCNRLKRVVDYYIRTNYPAIQFGFGRVTLHSYQDKFNMFRRLDPVSLKLVKQIVVWANELKATEIDVFKGILNQIERLQIGTSRLEGDFYDVILKWCTHLQYLSICNIESDKVIGEENRWLHRKYPTIEHIVLDDSDIGGPGNAWEIAELRPFFESNPNIRIFSTTFHFLWENRSCWIPQNPTAVGSSIQLDRLDVKGDCFLEYGMDRVCSLLNKLYEHGFHKRVHMYPYYIDAQEQMDAITSVKGLEKLYLSGVYIETLLSPMPDLREFCIRSELDFNKLRNVLEHFGNVERIFFEETTSNKIVDLVQRFAKVKEIKVNELREGTHFKDGVVDVSALNNERKHLEGACKTTIYVSEAIFLATKWAMAKTEFSLIELKRSEAVDWKHQFK